MGGASSFVIITVRRKDLVTRGGSLSQRKWLSGLPKKPNASPFTMAPTTDRPLDLIWDAPLPHALTRTRTYLSTPSSSTQVAINAIHGRRDNARDFAEAYVPHLRSYFGAHLLGELEEENSPAADSNGEDEKGLKITLRALEARDGIWFGRHTPKTEDDLAFQGPCAHSSSLELKDEIESLHRTGIPHSKIVLVGFSQGAFIVNSYLLRALQLPSFSRDVKLENGELVNSPLPLPGTSSGGRVHASTLKRRSPNPVGHGPRLLPLQLHPTQSRRTETRRRKKQQDVQCGAISNADLPTDTFRNPT